MRNTKLLKPNIDTFSRFDIAIYGLDDQEFKTLCLETLKELSNRNVFVLTSIQKNDLSLDSHSFDNSLHQDKIEKTFEYDHKVNAIKYDLAIINGNYNLGKKQIFFLDKKSNEIIDNKICNKFTQLLCIVSNLDETSLKEFLIANPQLSHIPIIPKSEFSNYLNSMIFRQRPELKAIVLAGGKSVRMGKDKSQIVYYEKPHINHTIDLLEKVGLEVFISFQHKDQNTDLENEVILDSIQDLGPFGALCSAFMKYPQFAFLVVPCDLPFIDSQLIQLLLDNRDESKIATSIKAKNKNYPEPLLTIYEPSAYSRLLKFLSIGEAKPITMLLNSNIRVVEIENEEWIINANSPDDYEYAKSKINEM